MNNRKMPTFVAENPSEALGADLLDESLMNQIAALLHREARVDCQQTECDAFLAVVFPAGVQPVVFVRRDAVLVNGVGGSKIPGNQVSYGDGERQAQTEQTDDRHA